MSYDLSDQQRCHLCDGPLIGGVCPSCDRPHRRAIIGTGARLWLHDHGFAGLVAVLALVAGAAIAVFVLRPGGRPAARAEPLAVSSATTTRPLPGDQSPSVFGVAGGDVDEFGLRELRGYAFVVRSADGVTDLLTDYGLIVDAYLQENATVDLQRGTQTYTAQVVMVSPDPHVALLRINGNVEPLPISSLPPASGDPVLLFTATGFRPAAVVPYAGRGAAAHLTFSVEVSNRGGGAPVLDGEGAVVGIAEPTAQFGLAAHGVGFAQSIAAACAALAAC
jgi:hypothetical protein